MAGASSRERGAVALAMSIAALLLCAPAADATPPTLVSVGLDQGRVAATWTLPPGMLTDYIEAAISPAVNPGAGDFPLANTVFADATEDTATSYVSPLKIRPGTYYVHVSAFDTKKCITGEEPNCVDEWSNILPLTVTGPDTITGFGIVSVASPQRIGKLKVEASMPEAGTITVAGTVLGARKGSKAYTFRSATASVDPGVSATLPLKLPKKTLKRVKKALKRHKKVRAKVTITARDAAGNVATEARTVKLKR